MTSAFSWQNSISLCPASFHTPRPNLLVTPSVSWLPTFAFQSPIMKRTSFLGVCSKRSCRSHRTVHRTLAISCLTTSNLPWFMDLTFQVPMQYCIEKICNIFTALDLASITSHIHTWVLFLLWLHPFILSWVISPLISSSILGTYRPGEFLFQYPIILPFHTVHGVLKERILKWFAIPFSNGPHSVRPLHHDPSVLGGPTRHGLVSLS